MTKERIVARTMLHSVYIPNIGTGEDAVVISEIIENSEGETRPNLRVIKGPEVSVWITQPQFRNHTDKKEFESLDKLDEITVPYKHKDKEIFKYLYGYSPNFLTFKQRREIYQSPYVYGANIDIEALIGMKYKNDLLKDNRTPHAPTTGFFDIEKSLLKASYGKLPLMSFVNEDKVFLAMKRSFMYEIRNGESVEVSIEDVEKAAHEHLDPLVQSLFDDNEDLKDYKNRLPFKYHFYVGDTEVDMIKWIVGKMHETKVSFIGVWNLGFDIPEIIKVLEENNIPLHEVFTDPKLRDTSFKYASFKEDKRKVDHFTQKWHWMSNAAHFQFIDSMCLFSYIRTVDGKEPSYALDDILKKYNLGGKFKVDAVKELDDLQTEDWHRAMLSRYFTYYALYAMWDTMSLQLLEWRNNDLTSMMLASDTTPHRFFPNQTIRATNVLFEDWKPKKYILGVGVDVEGISDNKLITAGGAVLEPQHLVAKGVRLFKEWPNHHTHCYFWLGDLDFSSLYPSLCLALNISKQTKVATLVSVNGDHIPKHKMMEERSDDEGKKYLVDNSVEVLCSYLITHQSNGYYLGTEFFNLPTFTQMDDLFKEFIGMN
jgi:DNA polymerase elongation subunit (family B)